MARTLRAWRAEQLLSTRRLATLSGTSNKTIVQIENGRQTPTFATMEKISRVLQVEPQEITEFVLALSERARAHVAAESIVRPTGRPVGRVVCVSAVAGFLSVTRQLLETGRYGVTTMIGLSVSAAEVACLQPAVVILDLGTDAPHMLELMQRLGGDAIANAPRIVVTGRDRRRLEEMIANLDDVGREKVVVAPFDRGLRELVAAVDSLTGGKDADRAT